MNNQDSCVLVTGAAGFIGSHVVDALHRRGEKVIGIDNFDPFYDRALKEANVRSSGVVEGSSNYHCIECDICDADRIEAIFREHRPSSVIHLAARAGVRPSIADPAGYARTNVLGTATLLEASKQVGCDRFIVASSSSVYGNNPTIPFAEEHDVSRPISPYASTKRSCELIAHAHWHLTGMPTACLRFFTVYGPRQRPDLAISRFLSRISAGEQIEMFGDGSSSRDYTFVDDIVSGVLASLDRIDDHGYRIWNLGGNQPVTLAEMVRTIARVVDREPSIVQLEAQPGDVERTFADLARSKSELGYAPDRL